MSIFVKINIIITTKLKKNLNFEAITPFYKGYVIFCGIVLLVSIERGVPCDN